MLLIDEFSKYQDLYNAGYRFNPEDETFFTSDLKNFQLPEEYKHWKVQAFDKNEYLNKRMTEIGVTEKDYTVELYDDEGKNRMQLPIFTASKHGDIEILQYSLHRRVFKYVKKTTSAGTAWEYRVQKRLNPNYALFCSGKYDFSEAKNTPFWHNHLIECFENKTVVETLVITEGQIKAFTATQRGIPTVGITSISHGKEGRTKELHTEIIEFIHVCKVKNVVILWDGDCRNISSKDLANKRDLADRPKRFFHYARSIRDSIYKHSSQKKVSVFHAIIKSADIEENPKGIDDLLIIERLGKEAVRLDFERIGQIPGYYIQWINISTDIGVKELRSFYLLDSVHKFYQYHAELIKQNSFIFFRNTYKIEKGMPVIEVSAELKEYKLIGTDFYREMECTVPVGKDGETTLEKRLVGWKADTIKLYHGKDCLTKIEKFKGFTNIPSHIDYQQVINEEWNLYSDVKHEKSEGEFPTIRKLLKHVFEEHYDNEMIIDYITVLYKHPMQKLPIVCLLSEEQGTGKSTFLFLLKLIFKQNMAIISNNEVTGEFNAHWTSKLVVACEETIFDKKEAYEKLKQYSTQKTLTRNEKNKSQTEIPCMLHFVLCSNHENDFMKISKYDRRLWVRKVKPFKKKEEDADITFDDRLEKEIPHFVHFIENREIRYTERGELYFHANDFQTDAFHNLVENSEPAIVKDIKEVLIDNFLKYGGQIRELTPDDLIRHFGIKAERNYVKKILVSFFKAERENLKRYAFTITNYSGVHEEIKGHGRPFILKDDMFLTNDQLKYTRKIVQTEIDLEDKE